VEINAVLKELYFLGHNAVYSNESQPTFRRNVASICRAEEYAKQKSSTERAASKLRVTCFMLVSCLAYSSALTMEATCSSKTSVDFHRTRRHSELFITTPVTTSNHANVIPILYKTKNFPYVGFPFKLEGNRHNVILNDKILRSKLLYSSLLIIP
jgi:hypothetical protein